MPRTMTYEVDGRIARITLNRPERGNGITLDMPRELAECVERADLDPAVHVIALSGNGKGFCGGYDLVSSAERMGAAAEGKVEAREMGGTAPEGSPLDPVVSGRNHDPSQTWDPVIDYQMMSRNVRGFMSLFHANKPVLCKVHGFCVAGANVVGVMVIPEATLTLSKRKTCSRTLPLALGSNVAVHVVAPSKSVPNSGL